MGRLTTNLRQIIEAHQLIVSGELILVGVSGGADSVALLHLLNHVKPELKFTLHIATLDHSLRPASGADTTFVAELAAEMEIPVTAKRVNVAKVAEEEGIGVELAGRHARYRFFRDVALEIGSRKVVTAHHLDDQAETVLMHLLRGSGIRGASGMQMQSTLPGAAEIRLIRPLLWVSHAALIGYCQENNLAFRDDPTNQESEWLRNRIRNEVIPLLAHKVNPKVGEALARFAEISSTDEDLLRGMVNEQIRPFIELDGAVVRIARRPFQQWHPAVQRRAIVTALEQYAPDIDAGYVHLVHAVQVGMSGGLGAIAEFPGGIQMRVDYSELVIETRHDQELDVADQYLLPETEVQLELQLGENGILGCNWLVTVERRHPVISYEAQDTSILKTDFSERLVLRSRQPRDRYHPSGLRGHSKKLSDWMIDMKIPRRLRNRVPILASDTRIIAIMWNQRWIPSYVYENNNEESIVWIRILRE